MRSYGPDNAGGSKSGLGDLHCSRIAGNPTSPIFSLDFELLFSFASSSSGFATAESVLLLAYLLINKQSMRILDPLLLSFVYLVSSHNDEYNVEPLVQVDYFLVTLYPTLRLTNNPSASGSALIGSRI